MIKRIAVILLVLGLAAIGFVYGVCITKIKDDQIGVRVNNIPYFHAVQADPITEVGYYFAFPKLLKIYILPKTEMSIEMIERGQIKFMEVETAPPQTNQAADQTQQPAPAKPSSEKYKILMYDARTGNESVRVKTADGNDVWVEVIVGFKVSPESAHLALQNIGLKSGDIKKDISELVNSIARGYLRAFLSDLKTEDILNTMKLNEAIGRAQKSIDSAVYRYGLTITSIEPQRVILHPDYDNVLQAKLIALEEANEYRQEARKLAIQVETSRLKAEGEVNSMIEIAKGQKQKVLQEAFARELAMGYQAAAAKVKYDELAKGIFDVATQLSAPGGEQQVGLAIAQAIQGKKIIIIPAQAMNLIDLNEILQTYGAAKVLANDQANNPPGAQTAGPPPPPPAAADRNAPTGQTEPAPTENPQPAATEPAGPPAPTESQAKPAPGLSQSAQTENAPAKQTVKQVYGPEPPPKASDQAPASKPVRAPARP